MEDVRDFTEVLTELRGGLCLNELSKGLAEVTREVLSIGKVGEVTLKIKIKNKGKGQLSVEDTVNVKVPKPDNHPTLMFGESTGYLARDSRRQMTLDDVKTVRETNEQPKAVQGKGLKTVSIQEAPSKAKTV